MIEQTPWFERKFEFNFPVGLFPVIVERLRGTISRVEKIVDSLSEEVLCKKINDTWSLKEHIGHLYDLEELWYGRIEDFLSGAEVLRAADLSNTKTNQANHNSKSIQELLIEFNNSRTKLINKVEHIDERTAVHSALHPRLQKPMRLVDSLFFVAEHDDHHLAKMRGILSGKI